jgi:hypothetical protein
MSDERQRDTDMQRSGDGNRSGDNRSGDGMPDETPDFEGHRDVDLARDTPRSDDGQDIGRDVSGRNID